MKHVKRTLALILCLCFLTTLAGCGHEFDNYRPIEDVNALEGRKVGVQIAWAADYILSPRDGEDLILYRYDTTADMLMALFYHQIDAVCIDAVEYKIMERTNGDALRRVEEPVSTDGYICYVAPGREKLRDDFNRFLEYYHGAEEFTELYDRVVNFDGLNYEAPDHIHPNGNGEKIKMAFCADYFPYCYSETDGTICGYDIEIMYAFADYCNYELELIETSYEDMFFSVSSGRYDIGIGTVSIAYAEEAHAVGVLTTDMYYALPLYLVELIGDAKPVMDDSMYITY